MAGPERVRKPIASNLQSTIRDLQRRKARGRRGLALIEGVRLVEEALAAGLAFRGALGAPQDRESTRLNSSHLLISFAVFSLEKKKKAQTNTSIQHTFR